MGSSISFIRHDTCPSSIIRSKKIDSQNRKDAMESRGVKKLLLLGPGDSGKSTLLKQMIMLHGNGYSKVERLSERETIRNVVASYIIDVANAHTTDIGKKKLELTLLPESVQIIDVINAYEQRHSPSVPLTAELVEPFKNLLLDPAIEEVLSKSFLFHIPYFASHFFDKFDEILDDEYIPSEKDMLRINIRSTGVHRTQFEVGGFSFEVVDVGGQRNERKKWVHFFEDTTAVLLVISISEFDQVVWEDNETKRISESLSLCREIARIEFLRKAAIIFFFNKTDLLCKKLQTKKLKDYMPEYTGNNDPMDVGEFLRKQFITAFQEESIAPKREMFAHFTTAVDPENIRRVFSDVRHSIIKDGLKLGGLV